MKVWNRQERLKYITHLTDLALAKSRQQVSQGDTAGASETAMDALASVRLLATASDEELNANRERIAAHF